MKKTKSYRLLSKTIFIYLIFIFLAFYGSALFLTQKAQLFINGKLEHRFNRMEHYIKHRLEEGEKLNDLPRSIELTALKELPDTTIYPQYSDTLLYNSETEEMQRFKKKTTILEADDQYYLLEMTRYFGDFYELKNEIFSALIPAFVLLAIVLVLFNYALSGYFFKPFNRILGQMDSYEVGKHRQIESVDTSTLEFSKMQQLFKSMTERIDSDYRNLKEYTENMAHEIQTPLTVITNKTENLLADGSLMQKHANDVKIIYDETTHLSKLGTTLNLLTKIENGEYSKREIILTKPVIERHVEAIRESAQLKSIEIEMNLSGDHSFSIDPFLLDIVIKNLLRNAIRYTKGSPVRIESTSDQITFSNPGEELQVPPDKLFERFFRYNGTRPSLGLGLSLVHKICELNNIRIDYEFNNNRHNFILINL